jgi:hypothetical protein
VARVFRGRRAPHVRRPLIAAEKGTPAAVVLYGAGFVLQIIGGTVLAPQIRKDLRAARRGAEDAAWENVDSLLAFVAERLSGRLWPRIVGLALIFAGAGVGLVANLLALS